MARVLRPHLAVRKAAGDSETDLVLVDTQLALNRSSGYQLRRRTTWGNGDTKDEARPRANRHDEIHHEFQQLAVIGFISLVMGTWEIMLTTNQFALRNGGLPGFFWTMTTSYIGQFFLVWALAPPGVKDILSYCTGWICSIGWQARFTAHCWNLAGIIQALITIDHPDYDGTSHWQRALLTIAVATAVSSFNAFAAGHLSLAEGLFAICHVFALVPILVSLWVLAPKHTAADVFLNFSKSDTSWSSMALSVLTGQSTAFFTFMGVEAVVQISEEIQYPAKTVPHCMLWSFCYNIPITFLCLLTYLFNMGSVQDVIDMKETPIIAVLKNTFDEGQAALAFGIIILLLLLMVTTSTMVATSRHLYAFGRDRGVLYSDWLSRVNYTLQVPLNAILCTWLFTVVTVVMTFASSVTLRIYICLSTACLHATYVVAVGCLVLKRVRHEQLPAAKWSLGRAGLWINLLALVYACWAFFWSFWPSTEEVDVGTYNWTSFIFGLVLGLAVLAYWRGLKRRERQQEVDSSSLLGTSGPNNSYLDSTESEGAAKVV